jgi:hypothetical protein
MVHKIVSEIVDCAVVSTTTKPESEELAPEKAEVVQMHEKLERPEMLVGSTYKVKTPMSEHALYITINDIVLNSGTAHEQRRPFEIFINSKNMDHFQWVLALTRVISAVFRKGGDATFLVEELKAVFDPKGGYFKRGGRFMPSLVAEIGEAIESHMKIIGLIPEEKLDEHQKAFLAKKRAELAGNDTPVESDFPASAQLCSKCNTKAAVFSDGCMTCLSCGDSKCG